MAFIEKENIFCEYSVNLIGSHQKIRKFTFYVSKSARSGRIDYRETSNRQYFV